MLADRTDAAEATCQVGVRQIAFKPLDAQGNAVAVANEKGVWHAWDGVSDPQKLNLTFSLVSGIAVGSMRGGGEAHSGTSSGERL